MNSKRVLLAIPIVGLVLLLLQGVQGLSGPATGAAFAETNQLPASQAKAQHAADRPVPIEPAEHAAGGSHVDRFSLVLIVLALVIVMTMAGRWAAGRVNQSAVLGELLIGVLVGNVLYAIGNPLATIMMHMEEATSIWREIWASGLSVAEAANRVLPSTELGTDGIGSRLVSVLTGSQGEELVLMAIALWMFSNLGVIFLLFMVGLESRVDEMLRVGPRALLVAVTGVAAPFALSFLVTLWLMPDESAPAHLFVAAIMCATSVGITARVFKDLHRLQTTEAKLILGAAVIDDVLGLIILAIVVGIVAAGTVNVLEIGRIMLMSAAFIGMVIASGERFVRFVIPLVSSLDRHHCKVLFPLGLCFLMAWLASQIELATIVGAFAAGLILNEEHFARHSDNTLTMEGLLKPGEAILAPIFFFLMGMQVNLASFSDPTAIWLALAFTAAGVLGKLAAGFCAGRGVDRLSVGIGMVPRGEVGLIMASVGKGMGVMTDAVFTAIVMAIIVTTLLAPIGLKWSLFRKIVGEPAVTT